MAIQTIGYDSAKVAQAKIVNNFEYLQSSAISAAGYQCNTLSNLGGIVVLDYSTYGTSVSISKLILLLDKLIVCSNITLADGDTLYYDPQAGINRQEGISIASNDSGALLRHVPACIALTKITASGTASYSQTGYYTITHNEDFLGKGYIAITTTTGSAYVVSGRESSTSFVIEVTQAPASLSWSRTGIGWKENLLSL